VAVGVAEKLRDITPVSRVTGVPLLLLVGPELGHAVHGDEDAAVLAGSEVPDTLHCTVMAT